MQKLTVESIFTTAALDILVERSREAQNLRDFWAEVDEMAKNPEYLLPYPSPIEFLSIPNPDQKQDSENAIIMLESLGYLNPADAADPRLWSFLALVTFREYMQERWPIDEKKDLQKQLIAHWLLRKSARRPLIRHGIARLWWIAALTHDPDLKFTASKNTGDAFSFTRWALENQDRIKNIFERQIGSNPQVRAAIFEALYNSNATNRKGEIESVTQNLYLESGFRHLDLVDASELIDLIEVRM